MYKGSLITFLAIILIAATMNSSGDMLKIPVGSQSPDLQNVSKPHQGMSKSAVKEQYGDPQNWQDEIGEPPISSWSYENFTVYFEGNYVIHSVFKNKSPQEIPIPAEEKTDAGDDLPDTSPP